MNVVDILNHEMNQILHASNTLPTHTMRYFRDDNLPIRLTELLDAYVNAGTHITMDDYRVVAWAYVFSLEKDTSNHHLFSRASEHIRNVT